MPLSLPSPASRNLIHPEPETQPVTETPRPAAAAAMPELGRGGPLSPLTGSTSSQPPALLGQDH